MRNLLLFTINVFICLCIFDPADTVFQMKVPLFCLCWFLAVIYRLTKKGQEGISSRLVLYIMAFTILPLLSINWYLFTDNSQPFDGFQYFKSYLFVSFAVILYELRLDFIRNLSFMLTLLSLCILGVYAAIILNPALLLPIAEFGNSSGLIAISDRDYGSGVTRLSAFFVTSPMLAISIAFYVGRVLNSKGKTRTMYLLAAGTNITAMFLAGTRNNMIVSLCLPLAVYFYYSHHKRLVLAMIVAALLSLVIYFQEPIAAMLNPDEVSNETKLGYLPDYADIFSHPVKLVFGEGLGSYHYWSVKAGERSITELTYLEVFRNYGLLLGLIVIALVLVPIAHALFVSRAPAMVPVVIGYGFYLFMSFSNPFIFSSLGMLILSILIANIFIHEAEHDRLLRFGRA
jgi:hypothetical protein